MLEIAQYLDMVPTFLLVLSRVSGLFLITPFFSDTGVPMKVKVLFSIGVSIAIFGQVPAARTDFPGIWALLGGMAMELGVGLVMGLAINLLFVGLSMGARLVSQQTGMALANVFDPTSGNQTPILGQLYTLLATVIFLGINGHHRVLEGLLSSFQKVPLLGARLGAGIPALLGGMMQGCFVIGIKTAAPALTTLLLTSVAIGFLQRTVPQLNILAVGFPIRLLVGLVMLAVSLMVVMYFFRDQLSTALGDLGRVIDVLSP
jgi:flagellar biosynthetic protein FliR